MKLVLQGERIIRLTLEGGGELAVESGTDAHVHLSPLHMLAASLATCTAAVLASWAEQAGLDTSDLAIGLEWDYVEEPYRVGEYRMHVEWPSLPQPRRSAALRVAEHCTVEQTLRHPTAIVTRLD